MKKRVFLKKEIITKVLLKSLFFLLAIIFILLGCKKSKSYESIIPYNITIDTGTLKIKVINPPLASGVDVTEPSTKLILFLFDSKNLFLTQTPYNGIVSEDTSIVLKGMAMGHYTALMVVDGPGITNLNYLTKGKQSYQDVVDTLQYLLTDTYVGSSQNIVVNQKENVGTLKMEPIFSIISQVTFDLKKVAMAWQFAPQQTDVMGMLLFQNGSYVRKFSVPDSCIKNSTFSIPIAQGSNYSFLFVDMLHQNEICVLSDSLKKGESTILDIQKLAERYNNNIRMGMVGNGQIPQPTAINLNKTIVNLSVENCMEQVTFSFPPDMKAITKPSNSEGLVLLEFQDNKLVKQMAIPEDSLKNGFFSTNVLKGNNYNFMVVDLLKETGKFYLSDSLKNNKNTISINDIQSRVEAYNQNMRMGAIDVGSGLITLNKNSENYNIINGLVIVSFDLSNLVSKPLAVPNQTDGFVLLEFKDGILIKQITIPYTSGTTTIPNKFTTTIVKSTNYSFVFADLLKTTDGFFALKDKIVLRKTTLDSMKDWLEPYLNQNVRMGSVNIANLNNTPASNPAVNSLIQAIKINFNGNTGCAVSEWSAALNWAVLVHNYTGKYKRTFTTNEGYNDLKDTFLNVWVGNKYTITAIGNFGATLPTEFTKPTTTYDTLKKYIPLTQSSTYAWLASDEGVTTNRVASNILTINATTLPATNQILSFLRIDQIALKDIPYLRALGLNYNAFACNPIRIEGIVTNDGTGENDIKNIIILQDKSATTNAAIPIQFKAPTGLKKGDKVTIAIQDGKLVNNNPDASNMLVLENVTYTKDPTIAITPGQSVTSQSLGNITSLTDVGIANKEAMLVSINNVEFRYWKGQTYSDVQGDSIQLRDASVAATTLLSTRARFRLKMNTLSPTEGFGFVAIPAGKGSVTGILAKNSSNRYAIQPRNASDVAVSNTMTGATGRVDAGVVVDWNPNASGYDGIINTSGVYKTAVGKGVSCNSASSIEAAGGLSFSMGISSPGTTGQGFAITTGFYVPSLSTTAQLQASTANAGKGFLIKINTTEMVKDESIQLTLNGWRERTTNLFGGKGTANINFKIQYRTTSSGSWVDVPSGTFSIAGVYGIAGETDAFNCGTITIPTIGGYTDAQIQIVCVNGGTWGTGSLDCYISFYRFTLKQIP